MGYLEDTKQLLRYLTPLMPREPLLPKDFDMAGRRVTLRKVLDGATRYDPQTLLTVHQLWSEPEALELFVAGVLGGLLHGSVEILVDDDGPGIPTELHDRIFQKGISSKGGTGMGLFDARRTVEQSGGHLDYKPSPRGGARFVIRVPGRSLR